MTLANRRRTAAIAPPHLGRAARLLLVLTLGLLVCSFSLASGFAPAMNAQVPPDGLLGELAFVRGGDVWVKSLPDGEERQLTTDHLSDDPRWSTSGDWLALRRRTSESLAAGEEISVIPAAGGARRVIGTMDRAGE